MNFPSGTDFEILSCFFFFQTSNHDKPSDSLQLMGGKVEDLGNRILGVDDGVCRLQSTSVCIHSLSRSLSMSFLSFSCWQRGKFLMVRCPSDKEYGQWKLALESQTADNVKATYVRPVLSCPPHPQKVGVVISSQNSSCNVSPTSKHRGIPLIEFYIIKAGFTCAPGKHHVHVVPMTIHSKLVNVNIPPPPLPPHPYPLWVTCRKR